MKKKGEWEKVKFVNRKRRDVTELTVDDLLKRSLLHFAVDSGNKELFERIHTGEHRVVLEEEPEIKFSPTAFTDEESEEKVNTDLEMVEQAIEEVNEAWARKIASQIYLESGNLTHAETLIQQAWLKGVLNKAEAREVIRMVTQLYKS